VSVVKRNHDARPTSAALASMLIGCTYQKKPLLSTEERESARFELANWPNGQIVAYRSLDGIELRGRFYRAEGRMKAVVIALHGMQTHSKWYAPLAKELCQTGVSLFAIDRRGSGLNAGLGGIGQLGPKETYDTWLEDISLAIETASQYGAPLYLIGNSWGGAPVLAWAESEPGPDCFRGTILLTPGLASNKPNWSQKLAIGFSSDTALLGTCLSVKDYSERRSTWAILEEDPAMTRQVSARFFKQTYEMRQSALQHADKIKAPILLILAGKDRQIKNDEIKQRLSGGISPANLKTVLLQKGYHLALIENPTDVAERITAFVDSTMN
jgi:acylglycerol lipase